MSDPWLIYQYFLETANGTMTPDKLEMWDRLIGWRSWA